MSFCKAVAIELKRQELIIADYKTLKGPTREQVKDNSYPIADYLEQLHHLSQAIIVALGRSNEELEDYWGARDAAALIEFRDRNNGILVDAQICQNLLQAVYTVTHATPRPD